MVLRTVTPVREPPSLNGVPPRYQVFDRRKSPPATVARFYRDPTLDGLVVFEVYDDLFREFLKSDAAIRGQRFAWLLDVDPNAPLDTRQSIVQPHPMPLPAVEGAPGDPLELDAAVVACRAQAVYRVIRTSDPV